MQENLQSSVDMRRDNNEILASCSVCSVSGAQSRTVCKEGITKWKRWTHVH